MRQKVIDERQKQDMMQIERVGFWVLFWGALAAALVQVLFMNADFAMIAGEAVLVILGGLAILAGSVAKGAWDGCSEPRMKVYAVYSAAGAVLCAIAALLIRTIRYNETNVGKLATHAGITFAAVFVILLAFYMLYGAVVRRRRKRLGDRFDDINDDKYE